jgi:hypothetical protein
MVRQAAPAQVLQNEANGVIETGNLPQLYNDLLSLVDCPGAANMHVKSLLEDEKKSVKYRYVNTSLLLLLLLPLLLLSLSLLTLLPFLLLLVVVRAIIIRM